ncbi:metastasis-associated protein MTA1 isoform X8 [Canis lupus familiaris]|uniref:metastasis-associated protein MTA1 isoform X8 n=1 Tax=Canis lupus familiaris TaxID=9615 RepID=UPI000BA9F97C|nr:metastasis-associated protein MTA1 isoform X8 [Canis lupus familiaris]XP_025298456.1 metastasis-associated protein MTA1 isoform X6 [Canis lupus dingo]XP_038401888.1 metastasis-associated protein MTA1 isoform X8 [Canis lupus familiaris]XP_038530795.1 metastasis-associated protein MTA1 isoform X8 [Canis lupus familiaris]|eukprot:XP_022278153.1 metastasis-associated protein MTA1 isoform X5 [Canis lupus familiaris]
MLAGASPHGGAVGPLERTELAWVLGQDLCSEWPFGCVPADTGLLQAFPGARGTARGTPAGDCSLASSWHRVTRSCPELPAISRRRPGWQLGGLPAGLGSVGAGQPPPWASWEIPGACQPPGDRSQAALEPEASWCPHDYVYFENSSSNPYLIRRIEELNKTANGNVEAKVVCFYRRRDISSTLIALADKHATLSVCYKTGPGADNGEEGEIEEEMENPEMVDLPEKLKHQLRHRELFLSRQLESLPATHIRGKCSVTLLNETESLKSYLEREDFFFYSLVYDPQQKTLLADKGEIRVGNRYQADITDLLKEGEEDGRDQSRLETKVWEAHNPLIDKQIDQFLVVARSVGTFARALDCSSSVRQPSLHMSAAAASRDITLFHAMDTLHKSVYDVAKAISALVPQGGPVLCRDEMEEWSASEASLFEEALEKYGKDFTDIQQDFLPWKSLTSIIEYYYMWKTTDRYVQQKRLKAAEAESKLKQVYIPNYNKPNPNQISVNNVKAGVVNGAGAPGQSPGAGRACESCYMSPLRILLDILEEIWWLENANPVRWREARTKPQ